MTGTVSRRTGAPSAAESWRLTTGRHPDPHQVLGAHPHPGGWAVRALFPGADAVAVRFSGGEEQPLERIHPRGLFSALLSGPIRPYRLVVRTGGRVRVTEDGYRMPPTVNASELGLFRTGEHRRLWRILGANRHGGGVAFTVWAPGAGGVRVSGDFNDWNGRTHPLRRLGDSGVWEVFVPEVAQGSRYRFEVLGADGRWVEKADPMARAAECPPANASVVFDSAHRWRDEQWVAARGRTDWTRAPISVYEVHLGSWSATADGYRELAGQLVDHVSRTGFTHVQLLPLAEHPFGGSWGYQVTSYFAPTARFGDPDGLRYLVDRLHQAGIGVFLDFVPAHFPRDEWALARFDGTPLYEHPDPRRGEHPDWGTLVFDFGRTEVRQFLISSALYWLEEFHVDGLRVDAVSSMLYLDYSRSDGEWLPNSHGGRENLEAIALLRELTAVVRAEHPGTLLIAEESTAWPGVTAEDGLGFHFKWNLGWMHDTLSYLRVDPLFRAGRHGQLRLPAEYAWAERWILPLSHDEVVHGKGSLWQQLPGPPSRRAAGLRALLAYMWAHPGKQLLFMGGEFGQPSEWDAAAPLPWSLVDTDPLHAGVRALVAKLNAVYRETPALYSLDAEPSGFAWLVPDDAESNVLAFLRIGDDGSTLACVANFSGSAWPAYRIGLPAAGDWTVVLDTEAAGAPPRTVSAAAVPRHGRPASAELDLPASSVQWLVAPAHTRQNAAHLPK